MHKKLWLLAPKHLLLIVTIFLRCNSPGTPAMIAHSAHKYIVYAGHHPDLRTKTYFYLHRLFDSTYLLPIRMEWSRSPYDSDCKNNGSYSLHLPFSKYRQRIDILCFSVKFIHHFKKWHLFCCPFFTGVCTLLYRVFNQRLLVLAKRR